MSMKKFQYRLESVLNYKYQMLDHLKAQQAEIAGRVMKKQQEVDALKEEMYACHGEFNQVKESGAEGEQFLLYDMCLCSLRNSLDREQERLKHLKREEEAKKKEVVAAKIDTSRYEKLKEKKWKEYVKTAQKAEEREIEEFVSNKTIRNGNDGANDPAR